MLRRSKIFIVTGLKHAISSVGAVSNRNPQVRLVNPGSHAPAGPRPASGSSENAVSGRKTYR